MIPARVPRACLQLLDAVTLAEVPAQMGLDPSGTSTLVFVASQVRAKRSLRARVLCRTGVSACMQACVGLCIPVFLCTRVHTCVFPIMCA